MTRNELATLALAVAVTAAGTAVAVALLVSQAIPALEALARKVQQ